VHPRLLTTPFFTVHTFGVLLAAAYLTALWWLVRSGRRSKVDPETVTSLGIWAIVGAIFGAKALLFVRSGSDIGSVANWWSVVASAGDFYGGFIGGLIASTLFFWRHPGVRFWQIADLCAPAIALGQAIGRIGCLMAGDDYGRPASIPWAVTFTDPEAASIGGAPLGVPLHPVQLYESVVCLVLFLLLVRLAQRRHREGDIIVAYVGLYAVARFVLEFFRGDADRGFVFGGLLSTSQFIGIGMFAVAAALFVASMRAPAERGRFDPKRAGRTRGSLKT
jgi:phosphatidylglycerol---prolipoprotein diacylglyceryl transferase